MKFVRILLLLALALIGLEGVMRLQGQSMFSEVMGALVGSGEMPERPVDRSLVLQRLASGEAGKLREAVRDLISNRDVARQVVPELATALGPAPSSMRVMLLNLLASLKLDAAAAAPAAVKLTSHPDGLVRMAALRAVSAIAPDPGALLPDGRALMAGVKDNEHHTHELGRLHPDIVDRILRHLVSDSPEGADHSRVSWSAQHLGPRLAGFAAWWIERAGRGGTAQQRLYRMNTAEQLGPVVCDWVAGFLDDPDPYVRLRAALTRLNLGQGKAGGREEKLVIEYLPSWAACAEPVGARELSRQEAESFFTWAFYRMARARSARMRPFSGVLASRLGCGDDHDRTQVVELLHELGVLPEVLPLVFLAMEQSLGRDDGIGWICRVGRYCADMGPQGDRAIPFLIRALDTRKDTFWVSQCAHALGGFGPRAAAALPRLRTLAHSQDTSSNWGAKHALEKIDPPSKSVAQY